MTHDVSPISVLGQTVRQKKDAASPQGLQFFDVGVVRYCFTLADKSYAQA